VLNIVGSTKIKVAGYYRVQVRDGLSGRLKHDSGWFKNLITDEGLDWFGTSEPTDGTTYTIGGHCAVGLSNTPPAYTDTQLNSFLARFPSSTGYAVTSGTYSYVAGPPPYWSSVKTYSFATGAVVGNIAEVGVGGTSSTDTGVQLFSHALILDGSGKPTTITVTASDALTITYELRRYIDTTDNTYSININGTTYGGTYRASRITSPDDILNLVYYINASNNVYTRVYDGSIRDVTSYPTGSIHVYVPTFDTYTLGTHYLTFHDSFGTGDANFATGISAIEFATTLGSWQFQVSPAIPKDSNKTMTLTWSVSWARY